MYLSSSNIFQNNEDISSLLQLPSFINFDFSKSTPIISPDKSFALFYDESTIINVDLKSKKIKWYKNFQKSEKPILTVIMTMHNQAHCIHKCLRSIKNQSIKNIEILIIDDCPRIIP